MFKVFEKPIQDVNIVYITKNYPGKAYILMNPKDNIGENGVIYPMLGSLHAISDNVDEEGTDLIHFLLCYYGVYRINKTVNLLKWHAFQTI